MKKNKKSIILLNKLVSGVITLAIEGGINIRNWYIHNNSMRWPFV